MLIFMFEQKVGWTSLNEIRGDSTILGSLRPVSICEMCKS